MDATTGTPGEPMVLVGFGRRVKVDGTNSLVHEESRVSKETRAVGLQPLLQLPTYL